jgi:hypothetical protein
VLFSLHDDSCPPPAFAKVIEPSNFCDPTIISGETGRTPSVNAQRTLVTLKELRASHTMESTNDRKYGKVGIGPVMLKGKVTSGMWRIDPQKFSRVIDRCGQPIASVESETETNANASLIAAAPDMFELLEGLQENSAISEETAEEIKLVLRRARGDFGLAIFSRKASKMWRAQTQEWLRFIEGLWNPGRKESP